MRTLLTPDNGRSGRRAKAALALVSALAALLIALGIGGMGALSRSGFDDAAGFSLIHKAGLAAGAGLKADEAMIAALEEGQRRALDAAMDGVISSLWRKVRYQRETLSDFSRADAAKRQAVLQDLLRETGDPMLKTQVSLAADALGAAVTGIGENGEPAFHRLILDLADHLSQPGAGNALRGKLDALERAAAQEAGHTARADSQALFEQAVNEKRLSRYAEGGAGMARVARALFEELMRVSPGADLSRLFFHASGGSQGWQGACGRVQHAPKGGDPRRT